MTKNFATQFDYISAPGTTLPFLNEVFVTDDGTDGQLIWALDATATPVLLAKVDPGSANTGSEFDPGLAAEIGGVSSVLYTLYDANLGQELWTTDGTAAGTAMVLALNGTPGTKNVVGFVGSGATSVLFTDDGLHGQQIWHTDGTASGTTLLATVDPGPEPAGSEFDFVGIGFTPPPNGNADGSPYLGVLYDKTLGQELWRSDGTQSGTQMVAHTASGVPASRALRRSPHHSRPDPPDRRHRTRSSRWMMACMASRSGPRTEQRPVRSAWP